MSEISCDFGNRPRVGACRKCRKSFGGMSEMSEISEILLGDVENVRDDVGNVGNDVGNVGNDVGSRKCTPVRGRDTYFDSFDSSL